MNGSVDQPAHPERSTDPDASPPSLKDRMDYAMKMFHFAADQRIKVLNFYLIILVASTGATLALGEKTYNPVNLTLVSTAHILIPIFFLLVEKRNRYFVYLAKDAMRAVESHPNWPADVRPFTQEDIDAAQPKTKRQRILARVCTYTFVMRLAFFTQIFAGLLLWAWVIFKQFYPDPISVKAGTEAPGQLPDPLLLRLRQDSQTKDKAVTTTIEIMKPAASATISIPDHP